MSAVFHSLPMHERSKSKTTWRLLAVAAALTIASTACSDGEISASFDSGDDDSATQNEERDESEDPGESEGSDEADEPATVEEGELASADFGFDPGVFVESLAPSYATAADLWPGFVPVEHPVVVSVRGPSDDLVGAIALNHPEPASLGDVVELSPGDGIESAYQITNLDDEVASTLGEVAAFSFSLDVGGVDSFVFLASVSDDTFFNPADKDYPLTLLHELFHRYQIEAFPPPGSQDITDYPFTAENIELAVLEERALVAALDGATPEAVATAARHAAAIRLVRLDLEPQVALDQNQEIGEGTARFLEHRIAGDDTAFTHHDGNFADLLTTDPLASVSTIKDHFGFDRFYASGAAQLEVLDRLGVTDSLVRVEGGESPLDILVAELEVTSEDAQALVDEAKELYDPLGELAAKAAEAAELAAGESDSVDENIGNQEQSEEDLAREFFSEEEFACLQEAGVDFDDPEPPSDEILERCVPNG